MRQLRFRATYAAGIPAAIVGSLAIGLTAPSAAVAAEPAAAAPASVPATHTVKKGDTVFDIAARYGLDMNDVLARNGLTRASIIRPGQVLTLHGTATPPAAKKKAATKAPAGAYTVRSGDTVSAIAGRHGVSVKAMLSANGLSWSSIIYPGQKLVVPGATSPSTPAKKSTTKATAAATHTVRTGDTVWAIAQKHGVSVDAVLTANGLTRPAIIHRGDTLIIPGSSTSKATKPAKKKASSTGVVTLDAEQKRNAQLIIRVGRQLGVPERGIAIALGAAMQESSLRNLAGGDRDSRGLFQQRPSTGWGTAAQVHDAERATRVFYGGPHDPNGSRTRGLLDIKGWQDMSFAQAAQAVQISAYPDLYARWENDAVAWLAALG